FVPSFLNKLCQIISYLNRCFHFQFSHFPFSLVCSMVIGGFLVNLSHKTAQLQWLVAIPDTSQLPLADPSVDQTGRQSVIAFVTHPGLPRNQRPSQQERLLPGRLFLPSLPA